MRFDFPEDWLKPVVRLQTAMYVAGFIGLLLPFTKPYFQAFTPLHLLSSAFFLVAFQPDKSRGFWLFFWVSLVAGYLIEVIGVHTGKIFGVYAYGHTLGPKLANVPPMIGINWFVTTFIFGYFTESVFKNYAISLKITIAAAAMTLFDAIIEPVAIQTDMWHWFGQMPPLQNYMGWFFFSAFLQLFFFYGRFLKINRFSNWLLVFQVLFFAGQLLTILFRS